MEPADEQRGLRARWRERKRQRLVEDNEPIDLEEGEISFDNECEVSECQLFGISSPVSGAPVDPPGFTSRLLPQSVDFFEIDSDSEQFRQQQSEPPDVKDSDVEALLQTAALSGSTFSGLQFPWETPFARTIFEDSPIQDSVKLTMPMNWGSRINPVRSDADNLKDVPGHPSLCSWTISQSLKHLKEQTFFEQRDKTFQKASTKLQFFLSEYVNIRRWVWCPLLSPAFNADLRRRTRNKGVGKT